MTDDNEDTQPPVDYSEVVSAAEEEMKQKAGEALQRRVSFLMDELKRLFSPDMRLTFIARSVDDQSKYSLLTEETDNNEIINLLNRIPKPKMIFPPSTSNASN